MRGTTAKVGKEGGWWNGLNWVSGNHPSYFADSNRCSSASHSCVAGDTDFRYMVSAVVRKIGRREAPRSPLPTVKSSIPTVAFVDGTVVSFPLVWLILDARILTAVHAGGKHCLCPLWQFDCLWSQWECMCITILWIILRSNPVTTDAVANSRCASAVICGKNLATKVVLTETSIRCSLVYFWIWCVSDWNLLEETMKGLAKGSKSRKTVHDLLDHSEWTRVCL